MVLSMPKVLCFVGTAIAALLLLTFGLDLATGFPFGGVYPPMDVGFMVCSAVLGYLSWATLREQV